MMRKAPELGLLLLIGLFLGAIGPYGTSGEPPAARLLFWLSITLLGGLTGIGLDALLRRSLRQEWTRLFATAAAMTPVVTLLVLEAMIVVLGHEHELLAIPSLVLLFQVFIISLAVMALRMLIRRPPRQVVERHFVVAPPLPAAEAGFRQHLSARTRHARLIALEAHDHYVRVHSDAGEELISLSLSKAVAELARAEGFRVHRSWWVWAGAIKHARWRRGHGVLELDTGLIVPISRSGAPVLRQAGWL